MKCYLDSAPDVFRFDLWNQWGRTEVAHMTIQPAEWGFSLKSDLQVQTKFSARLDGTCSILINRITVRMRRTGYPEFSPAMI